MYDHIPKANLRVKAVILQSLNLKFSVGTRGQQPLRGKEGRKTAGPPHRGQLQKQNPVSLPDTG